MTPSIACHDRHMADYGPGCPWPYSGNPLLQRVCASGDGGDIPADVETRLAALESATSEQSTQIAQLTQESADQAALISELQQENVTQAGQISDLDTRVAVLEAQQPAAQQQAIYIWDGTSYNVPAEPVDDVILRSFYGPNPYDGEAWPGVLDEYTTSEAVA